MWEDSRDPIDTLIDDAARRLTEGAPGADFEAGVLARIGCPRVTWRTPWILSPLAIAGVVLIAAIAYRARPLDRETAQPARTAAVEPADTAGDPNQTVVQPPADTVPASPRHPRFAPDTRARHRRTRGLAAPVAAASEVETLAPPALLTDSIEVERLTRPALITIEPLETTSIALAPIGDGDRP
jgi:hypothetical protein